MSLAALIHPYTVPIMAEAREVSRARPGGRLAGTAREPRAGALQRADAWRRADQQGSKAVTSSPRAGVSVERECTGLGPNTYRLALFRFAQDALILFDMALLAAALHGFRFRLAFG